MISFLEVEVTSLPSEPDIYVLLLHDADSSWSEQEKEEVSNAHERLCDSLISCGFQVEFFPVTDTGFREGLSSYDPRKWIVFNWCEGIPGLRHAEWIVARSLEEMGFVFTGSKASTIKLSYDKRRVKSLLEHEGVPSPKWRLYSAAEANGWSGFPAIVKPAFGHCSEWLSSDSVVMNQSQLSERISYLVEEVGVPALVEDFIDGLEFHVSLWGNGNVEMLPPAEFDFSSFSDIHDRLCTYEAKFIPGSPHYEGIRTIIPSRLTASQLQELEARCRSAYRAVGCRDYARMDVRLRDGVFYVLDVNPNPDISEDASMACAAEYAGYSYPQMAKKIVHLACKRNPWERAY